MNPNKAKHLPGTFLILCLALIQGMAFTGCRSQKKSAGESAPGAAGAAGADRAAIAAGTAGFTSASLAEAGNHFAIDLFKQIQTDSDNLIFSPYSINTVLWMCYAGAGGTTAEQMRDVLYLPAEAQPEPAAKELNSRILSADTLPGTEISLANAIWAQEGFGFLPEYLEKIGKWYDAPLTEMDFVNSLRREDARQRINGWVEENTRQKIKDLIGPDVLHENTRMVLTNAIYFNGKWQWAFNKESTRPSIFHVSTRQSVMTDFMHLTRTFPYYEDDEVQALRLAYQGERLSMTILLPRAVEGWEMISRILDNERLQNMEEHFRSAEVYLSLPKFTFEEKMNLSKELSAMGMDKAFSREADFSRMNGEKNLYIDEVIHKAFIDVSESGTEAAAATGAVISLKSALRDEPLRFNADHPFLYLIRDHQTGCILFIGRLVKPSQNS